MEDEVVAQATSTSVDIDQGSLEAELAKTLAAPAKAQPSVASEPAPASAAASASETTSTQYKNGLPPGTIDPWHGSQTIPAPAALPKAEPVPIQVTDVQGQPYMSGATPTPDIMQVIQQMMTMQQ